MQSIAKKPTLPSSQRFVYPFSGARRYSSAVADCFRRADTTLTERSAIMREIARYGTMAPNSHNTQPWKVFISETELTISPDFERRCPVIDPMDHHLFVTLGCAAENTIQAALAFGLRGDCRFDTRSDSVRLRFTRCKPEQSQLFDAIPLRQTSRCDFDGQPLSPNELTVLRDATASDSVDAMLFTEREQIDVVTEFVVMANRIQMRNAAFVTELKHWIRLSYAEAIKQADGLFGITTGHPAVPAWLGKRIFDIAFRVSTETAKYKRQMASSAGVAVFVGKDKSKRSWVEVGRCFERFALKATSMGVLHSHINQPVEVPIVRREFASWLRVPGKRPDLVIRFGRGKPMPKSLRRPLQDVVGDSRAILQKEQS